jgi:hypothetical protein
MLAKNGNIGERIIERIGQRRIGGRVYKGIGKAASTAHTPCENDCGAITYAVEAGPLGIIHSYTDRLRGCTRVYAGAVL